MIVYLSDSDRPLAGVPSHLREKKAQEILASWRATWGIDCTTVLENGIICATLRGSSRESVFEWLSAINAVCVDVEAADLETLAGRSVLTLAAGDLLRDDPNVQQECTRLEPSQIIETVEQLIVLANNASNHVREVGDKAISDIQDPEFRAFIQQQRDQEDRAAMARLVAAGFDIGGDPALLDAKPEPEPDGRWDLEHGIGVPAGRVDPFHFDN
jgi:hypothetical protein